MKSIILFFIAGLLLIGGNIFADDVSIDSNGNVKTGVASSGNLEVTGTSAEKAIVGQASGTGGAGVYGINTSSGNYGYLGWDSYGVFGYNPTGWAGYFQGNARVTGDLTVDGSILGPAIGDVTGVTAGTGLTGGGASGDVTLNADTTYLQRRVSSSCPAGSSIQVIYEDGTILCEADDAGIISETDPEVGVNLTNYVPRWDGSALVSGSIFDNGSVGVGTTAPAGALEVVRDQSASVIRATNYNSSSHYGVAVFTGRRARGTKDFPMAVQADDYLSVFAGEGYGTSGFPSSPPVYRGRMVVMAAEDWTDTAQGTHIAFRTTPAGSNSDSEMLRITSAGNIGIGTTNPLEKLTVAGTIESTYGGIKFPDGTTQATAATGGGNGDITAVNAGAGLTGGGTGGDVTLDADSAYLQRRVGSSCTEGSSVRAINEDGTVICETDDGITAESDPTVSSSVKDGVSWPELSGIPAGFADGIDDTGTGTYSAGTGLNLSETTFNVNVPLSLSGSLASGGILTGMNSNATGYGVLGYAGGTGGSGVYGDTTGEYSTGVTGNTTGPHGIGVSGNAGNTGPGPSYGGHFTSYGDNSFGVYGDASGSNSTGVYGRAGDYTGINYGGYFLSHGSSGRGVYAESDGSNGTGLYGKATGSSGIAVYGTAPDDTGTNYGGLFLALGSTSYGVYSYGKAYDFYASGPGVDYGTASSVRWKRNIEDIDNALEKVLSIRGVYYDWDEEHGAGHDMGFIAEEVGKVIPEIVSYEPDGVYATGVDYGAVTPMLVQAIKEQQDLINKQQAQLDELKTAIEELKKRL